MRKPMACTLLVLLVVAAALPAHADEGSADSAATVAWMRRTAHPFETAEPREQQQDLAFLKALVGKAHIVALGEGTHGTHEFFTMKHRITRYLASEMGFQVFAIEANMPEAYRMNDYVLTGRGDPHALLDGMYFWTWNTREVLDMVEWMRAFNASKRGRIQFTGFDMQTPDTAAAIASRVLRRTIPAAADSLDALMRALSAVKNRDAGFAPATGSLPAATFAGHRVRYSGWVRTERVSGFAGLWLRADSDQKRALAFDNMQSKNIRGTRGWERYDFELDIPANTTNINFGVLLSGAGSAWFDSLAIAIDGQPWSGDGQYDFALEGFGVIPTGLPLVLGDHYEGGLTSIGARSGRRCLRIARREGDTESRSPDPPVAQARELLARVERDRDRIARASTPAEADWAIQNVRVVEQCTRMLQRDGGTSVRDESMAQNVDWILAHEKPGTRIVLWAHNGHVARREAWMGEHLAKRHGGDMVVIGFAAYSGAYTAIDRQRGFRTDNPLVEPDIECLETLCRATGLPRFVLDLRGAARDTAASRWFGSPRLMRSIGAMAMDMQFQPSDIAREYDAIVYLEDTRATEPNHP